MKITGIELFHITIPLAEPYKLSRRYGTLTHANAVIVKMHTDAGIVGLGEADPQNPFTTETAASVMVVVRDCIAPHLMGQNPERIARIEALLDQAVHGNLMARGAVNMALYDILGKTYQVPTCTFLGGMVHERLPLLGPIGSGTPRQDEAAIGRLIQEGYRTVMIKMGALPISQEIERMCSAAEKFGDRLTIIADANQGWHFKQALQFVEGVRGCEPNLLEQPIGRFDIEGLRHIRSRAPFLLSADESVVTLQEAALLARSNAADVFSLKVSKNGGISKSLAIAKLAEAFGMQCLMNSMIEFGITQAASLQLGCTLGHLMDCGHAYMSVLRMSDDVTDFGKHIRDAVVTVPQTAGLGVEIDDQKLDKYTVNYMKI